MYIAGLSLIYWAIFGASPTDLVDGCPDIIERDSWNAQPPAHELVDLKLPARYIVLTHTATDGCFNDSTCVLRAREIQSFHMKVLQWEDIKHSFLIGGDGRIYRGRGWNKMGLDTFGWNTRSVEIAFIGSYMDAVPSETMMIAARKLIDCGKSAGFLSDDVKALVDHQLSANSSPREKFYSAFQNWPEWQ